jgi:N-acyl-L-homoserine lactone synthetase
MSVASWPRACNVPGHLMFAKRPVPVSHASPARFDGAAVYDQAVQPLSVFVSRLLAAPRATGKLAFREATSKEDLHQVYQFRIQQYAQALPYMLGELNDEGVDDFDHHSYTFGAWWNDRVVGSIRLTPHPFETPSYVADEHMAEFLGAKWRSQYLEWTRLLVDASAPIRRLMPALIVFAGIHALTRTTYRRYFGYASTKVARVFRRFAFTESEHRFSIPRRGPHSYVMLKGEFTQSLHHLLDKFQQQGME